MYGKQTVKSEFNSKRFPAAVHTVALVQLRATGLETTGLLKSEVAPKEIFVKLQPASVEVEYHTVFCISEGPFHHIYTTNSWCLKKYWIINIQDRNSVSRLICPVYWICPTYLFISSCLSYLQNFHHFKWQTEGERGWEVLLWSLGGISHQLSRSVLNFSCKTPQRLRHTECLPAHKDLFLKVTSGLSQSTQAKNKLAVSPIKKPCASQKLAFLNLKPFLFCNVNVVLVKLPECPIHYTVYSAFNMHDV